eukprot:gene7818-12011_t
MWVKPGAPSPEKKKPKQENVLQLSKIVGHWICGVGSVCATSDGGLVWPAGVTVVVHDWKKDSHVALIRHRKVVSCVAAHPTQGNVIACGEAGTLSKVTVWDIATHTPLLTIRKHKKSVSSIAFSTDGNVLITCGGGDEVLIWNWKSSFAQPINEHRLQTRFSSITPMASLGFLTSGSAGHLKTWPYNPKDKDKMPKFNLNIRVVQSYNFHTDAITSVLLRPEADGTLLLVSSSTDGNLSFQNITPEGDLLHGNVVMTQSPILGTDLHPRGTLLLCVGNTDFLSFRLMTTPLGQARRQYSIPSDGIGHHMVTIDPSGTWIAVGGCNGSVKVVDYCTGTIVAHTPATGAQPTKMVWITHSSGRSLQLLIGDAEGCLSVWKLSLTAANKALELANPPQPAVKRVLKDSSAAKSDIVKTVEILDAPQSMVSDDSPEKRDALFTSGVLKGAGVEGKWHNAAYQAFVHEKLDFPQFDAKSSVASTCYGHHDLPDVDANMDMAPFSDDDEPEDTQAQDSAAVLAAAEEKEKISREAESRAATLEAERSEFLKTESRGRAVLLGDWVAETEDMQQATDSERAAVEARVQKRRFDEFRRQRSEKEAAEESARRQCINGEPSDRQDIFAEFLKGKKAVEIAVASQRAVTPEASIDGDN